MRILHVAEPSTGGVPVYVDRISAEQTTAGAEVHLLAPPVREVPEGVAIHDWQIARSRPASFPRALRAYRLLVGRLHPDVVHLHSFVAGVVGRLPAPGERGHATVYQPHAWATDRFDGAAARAVAAWERSAGARTDAVVTNCADEAVQGRRMGVRAPTTPIGVPVDVGHFRVPSDPERRRARESTGFARPFVLVVGRIAYQKAQDVLVAEWERRPLPGADLVLLGDGDTDALARLCPHQWSRTVHHVPGTDDVRRFLWAADVVAVPSRYETVSLVAVEAMAVGTPVVTTRFNGAEEAVVEGGEPAGVVVEGGDVRGLLAACQERLADPRAFGHERLNGPRRVRAQFRAESVAARLRVVYERALETARRRG